MLVEALSFAKSGTPNYVELNLKHKNIKYLHE